MKKSKNSNSYRWTKGKEKGKEKKKPNKKEKYYMHHANIGIKPF